MKKNRIPCRVDGGIPHICFFCKHHVSFLCCKMTDGKPPKEEEVWDYEKDTCKYYEEKEEKKK